MHRGLTVTDVADCLADAERALARGDVPAARRALRPAKAFHEDEADFARMAQAFRHHEYGAADGHWQRIMAREAMRLMRERHAGAAVEQLQ